MFCSPCISNPEIGSYTTGVWPLISSDSPGWVGAAWLRGCGCGLLRRSPSRWSSSSSPCRCHAAALRRDATPLGPLGYSPRQARTGQDSARGTPTRRTQPADRVTARIARIRGGPPGGPRIAEDPPDGRGARSAHAMASHGTALCCASVASSRHLARTRHQRGFHDGQAPQFK